MIAALEGYWKSSTTNGAYVDLGYHHDDHKADGHAKVVFQTVLPKSSRCEVQFGYTPNKNRASKMPVTIESDDGLKKVKVN